jgi:hypothetical protein
MLAGIWNSKVCPGLAVSGTVSATWFCLGFALGRVRGRVRLGPGFSATFCPTGETQTSFCPDALHRQQLLLPTWGWFVRGGEAIHPCQLPQVWGESERTEALYPTHSRSTHHAHTPNIHLSSSGAWAEPGAGAKTTTHAHITLGKNREAVGARAGRGRRSRRALRHRCAGSTRAPLSRSSSCAAGCTASGARAAGHSAVPG